MNLWRPRKLSMIATLFLLSGAVGLLASSHREAPLISNDPLADNTDLYAFRSPDNPNTVTIIANYIPFELPEGGPNYYSFGENIRYEIHVDNDATTPGDDIIYRFTFFKINEDPTTFFNIRLGVQNLKTTYRLEKSSNGGESFALILDNGIVPPANIGPRSIEDGVVGLGTTYGQLVQSAIMTATSGEKVFAGPRDDPFWVDLGAIFDLGAVRQKDGAGLNKARDAVAGFNCHTLALQIPINMLQKDGKSANQAVNILDGDFVIGVWASASRPQITTLRMDGGKPDVSGLWVQVSRLGMPLTNEAVIPVGEKDRWNASSPHDRDAEASFEQYFTNPELALYMDDSKFGGAVPGFTPLRIQGSSLGSFDFRNGADGLFGLPASAREGTALADGAFGGYLLREGSPRSADILPAFYTGVPNLPPYQLATGKTDGPLSAGKPFVNNFLPTLGDMLRLNMAVPPTPRDNADFSNLGLIQAAVLGLTDPRFNGNTDIQPIPNMDGFPNGRRLEDDVTRIELQAVSGIVLAAVGLWYDDFDGANPLTQDLLDVLTFTTGVEGNDKPFGTTFPYLADPHEGFNYSRNGGTSKVEDEPTRNSIGLAPPTGRFIGQNVPNPVLDGTTLSFHLATSGQVELNVYDAGGKAVALLVEKSLGRGDYTIRWEPGSEVTAGIYLAELRVNGMTEGTLKLNVVR
ncbi:MAG: DUF4331 domain-containing protein [Ignavibacteriae bacterium]|nr:DUF4331 domain-containing protein [Ignavibacteriota bacterium]MCB9214705.1 DUF4331 domain-containing protein [Ignavibacteria bacterium]